MTSHLFKNIFIVFLFIFTPYMLMGCAATVTLQSNFIKGIEDNTPRFPLIIGLFESDKMKSQTGYIGTDMVTTVFLQPGLTNSLISSLKSLFQEVKLVNNLADQQNIDIIAVPRYDIVGLQFNLSIDILDLNKKKKIAQYACKRSGTYKISSGAKAAIVINILTVFIASPLAFPIMAHSQAEYFREELEKSIEYCLQDINNQIKHDLKTFF